MQPDTNHKTALISVVGTWIVWFFSNLEQIDKVLQFFALIAAITSSVCAARYYYRMYKRHD